MREVVAVEGAHLAVQTQLALQGLELAAILLGHPMLVTEGLLTHSVAAEGLVL